MRVLGGGAVMGLRWHSVPVPWTVAWTSEDAQWRIGMCPWVGRRAIMQATSPGVGKPQFGKPHSQRQRECIARDLCDLCGRPLKNSTKVSLSHARPQSHAFRPGDILQVEPLLHKECAAVSVRHCPSLKRDLRLGTAEVFHVTAHRTQFALMDEVYCESITGRRVVAVGHAKVELLRVRWKDPVWLGVSVEETDPPYQARAAGIEVREVR